MSSSRACYRSPSSRAPRPYRGPTAALPRLLFLGALFTVLGLVWLTFYALVAARGRAVLGRPRVRALLDYVTGILLVDLGVRVAPERRA